MNIKDFIWYTYNYFPINRIFNRIINIYSYETKDFVLISVFIFFLFFLIFYFIPKIFISIELYIKAKKKRKMLNIAKKIVYRKDLEEVLIKELWL